MTHWDVMNEHTHGLYYEEKLQDQNFTKNLFRQMRKCDSSAKLYFNDYQAVDIGGSTQVTWSYVSWEGSFIVTPFILESSSFCFIFPISLRNQPSSCRTCSILSGWVTKERGNAWSMAPYNNIFLILLSASCIN